MDGEGKEQEEKGVSFVQAFAVLMLFILVGIFILIAHYVHTKNLQKNPPQEKQDLGGHHPIQAHKLVDDSPPDDGA